MTQLTVIHNILTNIDKNITGSVSFSFYLSFSYQLELKHSQSVPASFSAAHLLPGWVYGGSSTVLDAMLLLDQYQRQLLPGLFCVNLDLRGSFTTSSAHPSASCSLSHPDAIEGLTMRPIWAPNTACERPLYPTMLCDDAQEHRGEHFSAWWSAERKQMLCKVWFCLTAEKGGLRITIKKMSKTCKKNVFMDVRCTHQCTQLENVFNRYAALH